VALALTALVLILEIVGSIITGSLALLSDAAHVFLDIFSLGISYFALRVSALPPDYQHSYGFHRFEVVAALANGITLALVSIGIFVEAYHRIYAPEPVKSIELLAFAVIGLVVNLIVAFVLLGRERSEHETEDLNVRSAFLHVVGDAMSSVGVITAAIIIWRTGWTLADPIASVLIGLIIIAGSSRVIRDSLHIIMEGVPKSIKIVDVVQVMQSVPGVVDIHDLHIWNICPGHTVLSAHVVLADQSLNQAQDVMDQLKRRLERDFDLSHTTIQFECRNCGQGVMICPISKDLAIENCHKERLQ
jgi:cobalt-zinc-cadmium efflux system protein